MKMFLFQNTIAIEAGLIFIGPQNVIGWVGRFIFVDFIEQWHLCLIVVTKKFVAILGFLSLWNF